MSLCNSVPVAGIVTDLFIDFYKFKGQNVKDKVPELLSVVENYDFDTLLAFFASPTVTGSN